MNDPIRVLFLCTGNAARSQMAEGLLRLRGGDDFEAYSAGTDPQGVHPLAAEVMQDAGIDLSRHRSKHLNEFRGHEFDYIITVCDKVRDLCPTFPDDPECIHWGYPDPVAVEGDDVTRRQAFHRLLMDLDARIKLWILTQQKLLREQRSGARLIERSRAG